MKIVYETVDDRLWTILSRLKGVKEVGENTYRAYSPLRDEKEPSLYITEKSDGFSVRKIGFERFLGLAAVQQPLLYGICAVILALFTGWLGGVVFRR